MLSLEGRNVVLEALRAGRDLNEILLDRGVKVDGKIQEILDLARHQGIEIRHVPRKELDKLSQTGVHQRIIARGEVEEAPGLRQVLGRCRAAKRDPFILVLTEVLYEQNLGAILRSAEGAGVDAVVVPPRVKGVTPVVARTSMGASEYVPVVQENLFSALKMLRDEGLLVVGAESTGQKNYFEVDLRGPVAILIGGEDRGLTGPLQKACAVVVKIPLQGHLHSLNMSVSAGILMFERVRQIQQERPTKALLGLAGLVPKGSGLPKDLSAQHDDCCWG